ncbi:MAG: tetratricopeptide repeat protein, partial [Actinobacteria bacterium]|nr:tetratricopeptide repeat protein [Actinomycetota bacterium]
MSVKGERNTGSVAESALVRGERHRADGNLAAAEVAYFVAACEAEHSAHEEAESARNVIMHARIGLGRIELMEGTPERALGWFMSARDVASDHWQPLYWQGCAQGWLGDYLGAERSLAAALCLNPVEDSITLQRSFVRFKRGDVDAALEDMLDSGERVLDDTAVLVLASLHLERGDCAEGERILHTVLDRDPSSIRACELMGVGLERRGRPDEAVTWYARAAKLDEASVARVRLGIIHARAGRPRVALDWLRPARRAGRPDDEVLYYSGRTAFEAGYFQESIDAWGELRRRRPGRQLDALVGVAEHELARVLI